MHFRSWLLCSTLIICFAPSFVSGTEDSLGTNPGSKYLSATADSISSGKETGINNHAVSVNPRTYVRLFGYNLKSEATGPFHTPAKTWFKVGVFAIMEGSLFFADRDIHQFSARIIAHNPGLRAPSSYVTHFGGTWGVYTLAALGTYGFIFRNNKLKNTTLLATQAFITAGVMSSAVKYVTCRGRPADNAGSSSFSGPAVFNNSDHMLGFSSSFPSGHTTAAFAAATVFASEYKDDPLIPVIAYSAAGLIGISRVTENAHWATDVLAGFALGYTTGRLVVRNYHRYTRRVTQKQKMSFNFNLNYTGGVIQPGLVCNF